MARTVRVAVWPRPGPAGTARLYPPAAALVPAKRVGLGDPPGNDGVLCQKPSTTRAVKSGRGVRQTWSPDVAS